MKKSIPRRGAKRWRLVLAAIGLIGYCGLVGEQAATAEDRPAKRSSRVPSSSNRQIAEDMILVFRANDRQERTLLFVLSGVAPRPAAKRKRGRGRRPSPSSYLISWMPRIPMCFGSPKANSDNVGSGSRRCEAEGPALAALDRKPEVRTASLGWADGAGSADCVMYLWLRSAGNESISTRVHSAGVDRG